MTMTALNCRFQAAASLAGDLGSRPDMRHTPPGLRPQPAKLAVVKSFTLSAI